MLICPPAHPPTGGDGSESSGKLKISQRAYVLENGRVVMSGPGEALLHDDRVRQAYLGL